MVDLDNTGESFLVVGDHEATKMWRFGIAIWKLPGVREKCLAWQAQFGFDVSFLVFLGWVGCVRREWIGIDLIQKAEREISGWRRTVIEPARAARKFVKALHSWPSPELTQVFALLRAVELRSELREQAMLLEWWRSQETRTCAANEFTQSVGEYVSTVFQFDSTVDRSDLERICTQIAELGVQEINRDGRNEP